MLVFVIFIEPHPTWSCDSSTYQIRDSFTLPLNH